MNDRGAWCPIDSGFWMFDTPCTQVLWEAVMGENLSEFKGKTRGSSIPWTR